MSYYSEEEDNHDQTPNSTMSSNKLHESFGEPSSPSKALNDIDVYNMDEEEQEAMIRQLYAKEMQEEALFAQQLEKALAESLNQTNESNIIEQNQFEKEDDEFEEKQSKNDKFSSSSQIPFKASSINQNSNNNSSSINSFSFSNSLNSNHNTNKSNNFQFEEEQHEEEEEEEKQHKDTVDTPTVDSNVLLDDSIQQNQSKSLFSKSNTFGGFSILQRTKPFKDIPKSNQNEINNLSEQIETSIDSTTRSNSIAKKRKRNFGQDRFLEEDDDDQYNHDDNDGMVSQNQQHKQQVQQQQRNQVDRDSIASNRSLDLLSTFLSPSPPIPPAPTAQIPPLQSHSSSRNDFLSSKKIPKLQENLSESSHQLTSQYNSSHLSNTSNTSHLSTTSPLSPPSPSSSFSSSSSSYILPESTLSSKIISNDDFIDDDMSLDDILQQIAENESKNNVQQTQARMPPNVDNSVNLPDYDSEEEIMNAIKQIEESERQEKSRKLSFCESDAVDDDQFEIVLQKLAETDTISPHHSNHDQKGQEEAFEEENVFENQNKQKTNSNQNKSNQNQSTSSLLSTLSSSPLLSSSIPHSAHQKPLSKNLSSFTHLDSESSKQDSHFPNDIIFSSIEEPLSMLQKETSRYILPQISFRFNKLNLSDHARHSGSYNKISVKNDVPDEISLTDLITIEADRILLTTFKLDLSWLISSIPALLTVESLIFHGDSIEDGMEDMIWNFVKQQASQKSRNENKRSNLPQNRPFRCVKVETKGFPFPGCPHGKIMIISYPKFLRIVVSTGNLYQADFDRKTQGIWFQDFPLKELVKKYHQNDHPNNHHQENHQYNEPINTIQSNNSFNSNSMFGFDDDDLPPPPGSIVDSDDTFIFEQETTNNTINSHSNQHNQNGTEKSSNYGFHMTQSNRKNKNNHQHMYFGNDDDKTVQHETTVAKISKDFVNSLKDYLSRLFPGFRTEFLDDYDYRNVRVIMITSVIGTIPLDHMKDDQQSYGIAKLEKWLSQEPEPRHAQKSTVYLQCSSIGNISVPYFEVLKKSFCAKREETNLASQNRKHQSTRSPSSSSSSSSSSDVRLIWPSVEFVRDSVDGYDSGGSLCCKSGNLYAKAHLMNILVPYQPLQSNRRSIPPHIKSYWKCYDILEEEDEEAYKAHVEMHKSDSLIVDPCTPQSQLGWMCLTSANLSKAAWGEYYHPQSKQASFHMNNFEVGVLFLPSIMSIPPTFGKEKHHQNQHQRTRNNPIIKMFGADKFGLFKRQNTTTNNHDDDERNDDHFGKSITADIDDHVGDRDDIPASSLFDTIVHFPMPFCIDTSTSYYKKSKLSEEKPLDMPWVTDVSVQLPDRFGRKYSIISATGARQ